MAIASSDVSSDADEKLDEYQKILKNRGHHSREARKYRKANKGDRLFSALVPVENDDYEAHGPWPEKVMNRKALLWRLQPSHWVANALAIAAAVAIIALSTVVR